MENNVHFSQDLSVFYLSTLAEQGYREEFIKFYQPAESYLEELIKTSTNLDVLNRVKNIIAYRTQLLEKKY